MRSFQVRTAVLGTGERIPLLVEGETGLPCAEPLAWLVMTSRFHGSSPNTLEYKLRSLAQLLVWCDIRHIDLDARVRDFVFLRQDEMFDLWDFMRLPFRAVNGTPNQTRSRILTVHEYVHTTRLHHVLGFISWKGQTLLRKIQDRATDEPNYHLKEAMGRLTAWMTAWTSLIPRSSQSQRFYGAREGLTPEQRNRLMEVILPGAPDNPFHQHQHRNYALIRLYLDHGLRLGEALGLKIRDLRLYGEQGQVAIHRRHDDPEDPRRKPALVKTHGRLLLLTDECHQALEEWITRHRVDSKRYPGAKKSPYLFISGEGQPLSSRSVGHIFERLRDCRPVLGKAFSSHVLRHDWNERWVDQLGENVDDLPRIDKAQKYAMGWSEKSVMPMRYAQRAIQKLAARHTMRIAARLQGFANEEES